MQDGDGVAEALGEARDDLRRQRDLGHEHDAPCARAPASRPAALQVDLGLARAGDAVQQQARRRARPRAIAAQRRLLVGRQRRRARAARPDRRRARGARRTARGSIATRPRASSRRSAGEVAAGEARQRVEQRALAVGQRARPRRGGRAGLPPTAPSSCRVPLRRQQRATAPARGRAVLARHPQRELDEVAAAASRSSTRRGATSVVLGARRPGPVTTPTHVAAAERHDEHRADADARPGAA